MINVYENIFILIKVVLYTENQLISFLLVKFRV